MDRPTWVFVTMLIVGFVASVLGQVLFDLEALTWTELAGLSLYMVGIAGFVGGAIGLWQKHKSRAE